jgi:major membrane immunogen (membrane-anchored lipoprotein)
MKKALISSVSLAALLLVGSCGVQDSEPSTFNLGPAQKEVSRFEHVGSGIRVWNVCVGDDLYVIARAGNPGSVQRIDNHEECK